MHTKGQFGGYSAFISRVGCVLPLENTEQAFLAFASIVALGFPTFLADENIFFFPPDEAWQEQA